jgi:hypothetical protein
MPDPDPDRLFEFFSLNLHPAAASLSVLGFQPSCPPEN